MTTRPAFIDFHFDVMCPYAYQTSLWIREVRDLTGVDVNWRFFSLEEINRQEGKKHAWEREWSYGWSMMRIGALLRRRSMADLDAWYARAGRALHVDGHKPHEKAVARHLLTELGVDPELVDQAIADPTTGDEVMAEHQRVVDAGGYGVPTIFFPDGQCLFGPVLIDPHGRGGAAALGRRRRLDGVPAPVRATAAQDARRRKADHRDLPLLSRGSRLGVDQSW